MLYKILIVIAISYIFAFAKEPVNELINEESPYLQQHAHNPVNWYPWGKKAFLKAKRDNKPIFLSIGYSTCHWCHVMESESFENRELASILNRYFIAIKVDREEHPQIDRYYQQVQRILTHQSGGWPLTIILTPNRKPFFAGTYIPRESKYNQAGLRDILLKVAKLWRDNPKKLEKIGIAINQIMSHIENSKTDNKPIKVSNTISKQFVSALKSNFDNKFGGWGDAPKFPRATTITTLLQIYRLNRDKSALYMADKTLKSMALGGIYDQVEGGFFRYSTDREWEIPHFEKMLYTNAELIKAYSLGFKYGKSKRLYKSVIKNSIELFEKYYQDKSGLFYGASDADSIDPKSHKEIEGFYYTYSYSEVMKILKAKGVLKPTKSLKECGITENGNFIRFRSNPWLKRDRGCSKEISQILRDIRLTRPYPFIDHKLQTSWNALMIDALFNAYIVDNSYAKVAINTLKALKSELYINGTLYHQKLPSHTPKVEAFLEDYSFTIASAIDAYEYSQDKKWLDWAKRLFKIAKSDFYSNGVWYDARGDFRNPLSIEGGAYRSPLAVLADDALRLAILSQNLEYQQIANEILNRASKALNSYPQALPMGVLTYLAKHYGYAILKIPTLKFKEAKEQINYKLLYPFLLFKDSNNSLYEACRVDSCFLYDKDEASFIQRLQKILSNME